MCNHIGIYIGFNDMETSEHRSRSLERKLTALTARNNKFIDSYREETFFETYLTAASKTLELLAAFTPDRVYDEKQGRSAALGIEAALLMLDFGISISNDKYSIDTQQEADLEEVRKVKDKYTDLAEKIAKSISSDRRIISLIKHDLVSPISTFFSYIDPEYLSFYDLGNVWDIISRLVDTLAVLCGFIAGDLERIKEGYIKHAISAPEASIKLNNSGAFLAVNTLVLNAIVAQEYLERGFKGVTIEIVEELEFTDSINLSGSITADGHILRISNFYPMSAHDAIVKKMQEYSKGDNGFIHGLENAINLYPVRVRLLEETSPDQSHGTFEIYLQLRSEDVTILP
jgi:hypothetical protein